jgi:hypothetical protein
LKKIDKGCVISQASISVNILVGNSGNAVPVAIASSNLSAFSLATLVSLLQEESTTTKVSNITLRCFIIQIFVKAGKGQ